MSLGDYLKSAFRQGQADWARLTPLARLGAALSRVTMRRFPAQDNADNHPDHCSHQPTDGLSSDEFSG
jgi:hypothetical protein